MRAIRWAVLGALLALPAEAADLATSYAVPGAPSAQRVPPMVTLCPSSDGTNTAVACTAAGGGSVPTGTAGAPNAAVMSVQGITGGTPQPALTTPGTRTLVPLDVASVTTGGAAVTALAAAATRAWPKPGAPGSTRPGAP